MGRFAKPADVAKTRSSRLPLTTNRKSLLARPTSRTSGIPQPPKFVGSKIAKMKEKTIVHQKSSKIVSRKSVRFEGVNLSAEKQGFDDMNEAGGFSNKMSSQVGDDFVFEADPDALASILNEGGVSSEQLRKSQIAEAGKKGDLADEFLLAGGRPSLCRRIPTNRTSSILPDGRPSMTSRISQGPGRIARTSTTGRSSISIRRGSVIQSSTRDSMFSFIERRYSQRQQPATAAMNPPALPRPSLLSTAKPKQHEKVEFKDQLQDGKTKDEDLAMSSIHSQPRRVLNSRQVLNLQNIASPALRVYSPVHPILNTPASRVKRSVKKTPGISRVTNAMQDSDRMKDKLATVLKFAENEENQSPEISRPRQEFTQPRPKNTKSKLQQPRQSMSRIRPTSQISKRQSLQKNASSITNKSDKNTRNSTRFSIEKQQTTSKKQDEIQIQYVETDLKFGEELVQPKTLNDNPTKRDFSTNKNLDSASKITESKIVSSARNSDKTESKKSENTKIMTPQTLNDVTKPTRVSSQTDTMKSQAVTKTTKVTSQLKKPESRIPSYKAKKANVEDVLELMRKKLAKINRRSVQAEFSSVIKSVEMDLASVTECSEECQGQVEENKRSPANDLESSSQGLKSWKEVLSTDSSPTWKEVLKKDGSSKFATSNSDSNEIKTIPTQTSSSAPRLHSEEENTSPTSSASSEEELRAKHKDCLKQVVEVEAESKNLEEKMKKLQIKKHKLESGNRGISKLFTPRNLQMPDMSKTQARIMKVLDSKLPSSSTKIKLPATKYFGPVISPPDGSIIIKNTEVLQTKISATRCQPKAVKASSYVGALDSPPDGSITCKNPEVLQTEISTTRCQPRAVKATPYVGALQNDSALTSCPSSRENLNSGIETFQREMPTIRCHPGAEKFGPTILPTRISTKSDPKVEKNSSQMQTNVNINPTPNNPDGDLELDQCSKETLDCMKTVKWSDCSLKPAYNTSTERSIPTPSADFMTKPECVKNMSWGEELCDGKNKITSGRIGAKVVVNSQHNKQMLPTSEKCPIMSVISPNDGVRNCQKHPPILKERLISKTDGVFRNSQRFAPTFAEFVESTPPQKGAVGSTSSSLGCISESILQNATIFSPKFCEKYGYKYNKNADNSWIDNLISSPVVMLDFIHSEHVENGQNFENVAELPPQKCAVGSTSSSLGCISESILQNATIFSPEFCEKYGYKYNKNADNSWIDNLILSPAVMHDFIHSKQVENGQNFENVAELQQNLFSSDNILKPSHKVENASKFSLEKSKNLEKPENLLQGTIPPLESLSIIEIEVRKNAVETKTDSVQFRLPVPNINPHSAPGKPERTSPLVPQYFEKDNTSLLHHKSEIDINGNHVLVPDLNGENNNEETKDNNEKSDVKETKIFSPFVTSSLSKFFEGLKKSEKNPKYNLLDFTIIDDKEENSSLKANLTVPLIPIPSGGLNQTSGLNMLVTSDSTMPQEKSNRSYMGQFENSTSNLFPTNSTSHNQFLPVSKPATNTDSLPGSSSDLNHIPELLSDICKDHVPSGLNQYRPVPKPALLPGKLFTDVKISNTIKKPSFDFSRQDAGSSKIAAPKPIKPPPPQTPAAFRMLRKKFRESPTPKKCRVRSPFTLQSPSRGISKNFHKKSSIMTSSPSIKSICTKRFAEALLDEEVALFTCRKFRSTTMTPSKKMRKASSMNPLGRVLLEGDDSHFIPLSPITGAKPVKPSSTINGSAFSAFTYGT